jgi:pyridoxal phosphate enzyme (YggS family)
MSNISKNIESFKGKIPPNIKLVAVSKTKSDAEILEALDSGHLIFGENKVQELADKYPRLPKQIQWHFIGHLQRNKVKYIAPFVELIHAVDSLKLLKEINKQALKNKRTIHCLLQFHIADEEHKFGLEMSEAKAILQSAEFRSLANVKIAGVMGMATYTTNKSQIKSEFARLHANFLQLKTVFFSHDSDFKEISMGMSGDYKIAIEEGSTMIRIGSAIFGPRNQ